MANVATVSGETRQEAFAKLVALRERVERGEVPRTPEKLTVAEFLDRWLELHVRPNTKLSSLSTYAQVVRLYIVPHLGTVRLDRLSPAHVQKVLAELEKEGKSPQARRHAHSILSRALNVAVSWGLLGRNPAKSVQPPRVEGKERVS